MSDCMRNELSKKNKYWMEKHRYLELKHFCLQYPIWKEAYSSLGGLEKSNTVIVKSGDISDQTARIAITRLYYKERMEMIEKACAESDAELCLYLLDGVTNGKSYTALKMLDDIPCCKDVYYDRYRKFFYILNKIRN